MIKSRLNIALLFLLVFGVFFNSAKAQEGQVTVNQSEDIDELLKLKKDINRSEQLFKIQIYSGSFSGVENAKTNFTKHFPGWAISTEFETPNYKIWVGNFKTRLEADRALLRVKKKFSSAFIFKPKKDKKLHKK